MTALDTPPKEADTASTSSSSETLAAHVRKWLATPELSLAVAVALVAIFLEQRNSIFGTWGNIRLVVQGAAPPFAVTIAATLLMVGGGLDLSVGSVAALTGVVTGKLMQNGTPVPLAIAAGIGLCIVIGGVNGWLITRVKIPSLIVTLGGLYAYNGVALQITSAQPVAPLPKSFNNIAQGYAGTIPLLLIYVAVIGVIGHLVLNRTTYGYRVRAVGGNAEAARASGVSVDRIRVSLYILSSVGAGLTGMLFASQIGNADPNGESMLLFTAVSAVIIGGTSLFGGIGTVTGTALGVLLITILSNGLVLLSISPFYQQIVVGAVIVGAVAVDGFRRTHIWSRGAKRQDRDA